MHFQTGRQFAGGIAILGILILALRVYLRMADGESFGQAISYLSQFFTILSNTLVVLIMGWIAVGRRVQPSVITALTIAICCVGVIYHAVLAQLVDFQGLALVADHGVHTVMPLLTVIWWLWHSERRAITWSAPVIWVIWPIVYCGYALTRAVFSGFYPYPFLNLTELGWNGLMVSIFWLIVVFIVAGIILTALRWGLSKVIR